MIRLFILLWLIPLTSVASDKQYGSVIVSEVTSIYDADTFRVNIKGYPPIVGERIPIRILGIDAPELRGKCESEKIAARKAKKHTVNELRTAKVIELKDIQRGKYFRILAHVFVDGKNLGKELIKAGHARAYDGGKRGSWCILNKLD